MTDAIEFYNGYPIFPFCPKAGGERVIYNRFRNSAGDGYRYQALFGSKTGLRTFEMDFQQIMVGRGKKEYHYEAADLTKGELLWTMFQDACTEGQPFIVRSGVTGNNYLVEPLEPELFYSRSGFVGIYNSNVTLQQVRIPGVTVYDPLLRDWWGAYSDIYNSSFDGPFPGNKYITDLSGNNHHFKSVYGDGSGSPGDIILVEDAQNGRSSASLNSDTGGSMLQYLDGGVQIVELYMMLKISGSAISNNTGLTGNAGVISAANLGNPILNGIAGTTKFFNYGYSPEVYFYYSKNGVEKAESDMQAPMGTFGLVYWRLDIGSGGMDDLQLGRYLYDYESYLNFELGEMYIADKTNARSISESYEMIEHLCTWWNTQ